MTESVVKVSMIDDNNLECAIFDFDTLKEAKEYKYLLLKHYDTRSSAYTDFLKLIGKMCKKREGMMLL